MNRRATAVDPRRLEPGDQRRVEQTQESDEEAEADDDGNPAADEQGEVKLGVDVAVGLIVVVMLQRLAGNGCDRVLAGVLRGVLEVVQVLHRAGAKPGEAQQQKNGGNRSAHARTL